MTRPRPERSWALAALSVAAVMHIACASGGGRAARPPDAPAVGQPGPHAEFEGEWRLVGLEVGGAPRKATGYLRYDRFATITVHAELAGDEPSARPPRVVVADFTAKASPSGGQFQYIGLRLGVDRERLTEDAVPMEEWRHYQLSGDTLRLSVGGGSQPAASLVFQRAG
jgi:hypothetical protein